MNVFPESPDFEIGTVGFDSKDAKERPLDLLGRKALGQRLTDLVDRVDQPLVIALDGAWGSGKSHFLKLWAGAHKPELDGKAKVIYFDAFEHDYLDDPLVSLVATLTSSAPAEARKAPALTKVKRAALVLGKGVLRAGAAAASFGVTDYIAALAPGLVEAAVGGAIDEVESATDGVIDRLWAEKSGRIAAMQHFRAALEDLTKAEGETFRKIVIIVDELDRCRPDYALSLLETVKHFFSVPNVHFVLGTNLSALENSVKARYGAEINATKYIQKFLSLSLRLPNAGKTHGSESAAYDYFMATASRYAIGDRTREIARETLKLVMATDINLRDIDRILTLLALLPKAVNSYNMPVHVTVVGATFLRVLHPDLYLKIRNGRADMGEIEPALGLVRPISSLATKAEGYWLHIACCIETMDSIFAKGVPQEYYESVLQGSGHWGMVQSKPDLRGIYAEVFDSLTLP